MIGMMDDNDWQPDMKVHMKLWEQQRANLQEGK